MGEEDGKREGAGLLPGGREDPETIVLRVFKDLKVRGGLKEGSQ